ncbi:group II intron maturase-specific domain-containing protein [Wolbachia endosymbiont of Rhagoletis cingulata]|uniref:group II intron maturase-specific domain-containing protein n=1 Tax=Wolbachia endosymbiont of Rhagoletis cingulata TaxID=1220542 RepID=UPI003AF3BCB1
MIHHFHEKNVLTTCLLFLGKVSISKKVNPIVRGWFQYYGRFYKSEMYKALTNVEWHLVGWARAKYKKLRNRIKRAKQFLAKVRKRSPDMFYHWTLGLGAKG